MYATGHCPVDIWWLTQQISEYNHDAVVFQELLATETQDHLRGDQWIKMKSSAAELG